ncbi:hypothetical protein P154DRAFT_562988 [Amniculicola lignicola CBS 123094]|uniref:F-box domain-containing protein n=1 Tax=Amniculicola lignicola CBS 123094 TaxID=1392246 RepID=A0A6A5WGP6_9PLEO|nr:hypothetical protein P154DRAFT_562988 [Amniculicola lignicola CBS 123094]
MGRLLDCPSELIHQIGQNLELADIRALRLCCSTTRDGLAYSFERRFFKTASVRFTTRSLSSLRALSASKYSKYIDTLIIRFDENLVLDAFGHPNTVMSSLGVHASFLGSDFAQTIQELVQDKIKALGHLARNEFLIPAMKNFKNLRAVELTDHGRDYFAPHVYEFAQEILRYGSPSWMTGLESDHSLRRVMGYSYSGHPFIILARALEHSRAPVETLSLQFTMYGNNVFNEICCHDSALKSIRCLSLEVDQFSHDQRYLVVPQMKLPWAINIDKLRVHNMTRTYMTRRSPNVEVLKVENLSINTITGTPGRIWSNSRQPVLKVLELSNLSIDMVYFRYHIWEMADTLEIMKFRSIQLQRDWRGLNVWVEKFRSSIQLPNLKKMVVCNLTYGDEALSGVVLFPCPTLPGLSIDQNQGSASSASMQASVEATVHNLFQASGKELVICNGKHSWM